MSRATNRRAITVYRVGLMALFGVTASAAALAAIPQQMQRYARTRPWQSSEQGHYRDQ